jgi:hypothetical protein
MHDHPLEAQHPAQGLEDQGLKDQGLKDQGLKDQGLEDQGLEDAVREPIVQCELGHITAPKTIKAPCPTGFRNSRR